MKKRHLKIKWKVSSFWEPFFATLIICFVCIIPYMRTLNSFNTIELYQHVYARSSLMLILIGVWPLAKRCDAMKTTIFSGNYCILQKALISGTVAVLCGEACVIAVFEFISSSGQNGDYLHIPVWGFIIDKNGAAAYFILQIIFEGLRILFWGTVSYVKYPKDKHQLIIDPDAAEIVKLIFSLFLKGTSKRAIALYLNEHGVPSPSAYKLQKGIPVSTRGYDDPMWGARMIHSILTNPTYTGDLAQGRSRVKSYKVHEVESVPREEWVEVAGTHEAIIDYETFDKVQALLQRDTRTSPKGREVHLFSGFLKCADCGRAITRSVGNNNNVYYACSTYKNRSRTACTMHSIKHNRLEAAVLFAVQQQIHLAVSYSEMIARINTAPVKKSQSIRLEELIAAKERELAKISRYKQSLYQDWKDGEITQQDYRDMKADYERQTIALTDVLARLNAERAELANGVKSEHPALVAFTKHQNIDQLSRELLVELIDHIKVYENGNISVRFKFADEFRRIAEYIEINTTKPAVAG